MFTNPDQTEINHRTIKLLVGAIAISLASLTSFLSEVPLTSISESYYQEPWPRNIFVGFLFAIAAFMFAYNGQAWIEMAMSKVAAVAALGVAMFPCACNGNDEIIPHVHYICAGVMFAILTGFCYVFYRRAIAKAHTEARVRAGLYALCGLAIVVSMVVIAIQNLSDNLGTSRVIFAAEATGLVAFGVSWLTASHVLPFITSARERVSLW